MRTINYKPKGICAVNIEIILDDDNIIQSVGFQGGCDGNHKGLNALCKGRHASEVSECLSGLTCGFKSTSCPDQLSRALKENGF